MMSAANSRKDLTAQQQEEADRLGAEQREKLLTALSERPGIKRLAVNPLMLTSSHSFSGAAERSLTAVSNCIRWSHTHCSTTGTERKGPESSRLNRSHWQSKCSPIWLTLFI
jgi:hypothetical protein